MLWQIHTQSQVSATRRTANNAASKVDRVANDLTAMQRHLDRLSLACQAMWELVRENTNLTEQDIESKILEIDGRSGQIDGKINTQRLNCSSCGSPTNSKRPTCVMCGAPIRRPHRFE